MPKVKITYLQRGNQKLKTESCTKSCPKGVMELDIPLYRSKMNKIQKNEDKYLIIAIKVILQKSHLHIVVTNEQKVP